MPEPQPAQQQQPSPGKETAKYKTIKDEIHCKIFRNSSSLEKRSSKEPNCDSIINASDITSDISKRHEVVAAELQTAAAMDEAPGVVRPPAAVAEESDSDDSCIILDNVTKPAHLVLDPPPDKASFIDDNNSYNHKKNIIYAAYGRSQSRQQDPVPPLAADNKLKTPDLSESSECSSDSSLSSCESSLDESMDIPMDSAPEKGSPDFMNGDMSPPPPTLEPALPGLVPLLPRDAKTSDNHKSKLSTNEADNKHHRVECASQTVESGFPYIPSASSPSSKEAAEARKTSNLGGGGGALPPLLQGLGADVAAAGGRGRPRKNPPMLRPQNTTESSDDEKEEEAAAADKHVRKSKKLQKKKDKLSVLYSVAKQLKRRDKSSETVQQEEAEEEEERPVDDEEEEGEDEASSAPLDKREKGKRFREKRRSRHLKSGAQKQSKHRSPHKESRIDKKKSKRRRKSAEESQESEKARRHKEKRERRKTKSKDRCFECEDYSPRGSSIFVAAAASPRPVSRHGRRPSSSQDTPRLQPPPPARESKRPASTDQYLKSGCSKNAFNNSTSSKAGKRTGESNNFLAIFTSQPGDGLRNHFASPEPGAQLLFPKKFCNLKPEKFWKKSKRKHLVLEDKLETESSDLGKMNINDESSSDFDFYVYYN